MLLCWWLIVSFSWFLDQSLDFTILETVPKPWELLSAQSVAEQIYGCLHIFDRRRVWPKGEELAKVSPPNLAATRFAENSRLHHHENCTILMSAELTS